MPGAPGSFLFLVVRPGAPSSVLATNSDGLQLVEAFVTSSFSLLVMMASNLLAKEMSVNQIYWPVIEGIKSSALFHLRLLRSSCHSEPHGYVLHISKEI